MWAANLGYFDWSDPVTKGRAEVKWSLHQQRTKQRHVAAPIRTVTTASAQAAPSLQLPFYCTHSYNHAAFQSCSFQPWR